MADTPPEERKFTDDEVREILKRAVARRPSRALTRSEGVSLSELTAAAAEVGIDPARVEDAARAITVEGENRPNRILGGPLAVSFERKAEGELDRDDTHEVLSTIRRVTGQQGKVNEIHGSVEWSARTDTRDRYVTLTPRAGTTTIRTSSRLVNLAVLTYIPAGVFGLVASFVGLITYFKSGSEIGLVVFFVVLPVLYAILRTIFYGVSRSESANMERLADELARLAER